MIDNYSTKVNLARVTFALLLMTCWILYKYHLGDYILLVLLIVLFCGIFTISTVDVTSREVRIKKSYFWGLLNINKIVTFEQIRSIKTKDYEIPIHEDISLFAENIFSSLALEFLNPKVKWLTSKLYYVENGENKDIELKISRDNYKDIETRIVIDDYQALGRRRKDNAKKLG